MLSLPFNFEVPVAFFEKADAEPGQQRRIGGIATTDVPDKQKETVLQEGLDFTDFLGNGWFNDNHSKATDAVLGYPTSVHFFRRGEILPDGTVAEANGHWVEGYLLDTERANRIWELGRALQKTDRRLGFSVEGGIQRREGQDKKVIAKALVRNVAITNCPVNTTSRMEILARSLSAMGSSDDGALEKAINLVAELAAERAIEKALTAGTPTPGVAVATQGPKTGEGAGQVLTPQSLEDDPKDLKKRKKQAALSKALSGIEALAYVRDRLPHADLRQALEIIELAKLGRERGRF